MVIDEHTHPDFTELIQEGDHAVVLLDWPQVRQLCSCRSAVLGSGEAGSHRRTWPKG